MKNVLQLQEEQAELTASLTEITELLSKEGREETGEDKEKYDKVFNAHVAKREELQRAQYLEDAKIKEASIVAERTLVTPESNIILSEDRSLAFQAWGKNGLGVTDAQTQAAIRCGVDATSTDFIITQYNTRELRNLKMQKRADMGVGAGVGGETIPEGFTPNWEMALLKFGGMRSVATILRTDTGNDLPFPTTNDTANIGELVAEAAAAAELGITTSSTILGAFAYSSKLVPISKELLQDSAFDVESEVAELLGIRIGRISNQHFTTGSGSGQPTGIVTASTEGVSAVGVAAITYNELIDLVFSVDEAYRVGAKFMCSDATFKILSKLVDGEGRPIFGGFNDSAILRILGHEVVINNDMPAATTGLKSVVFGDLSTYVIREVLDVSLERSDHVFFAQRQVAFLAWARYDGNIINAGTNPVKHLVQA